MKILSDSQREALLKAIADAPDDLLLEAANSVKQYRLNVQRNFEDIRGYVGMKQVTIGQPVSSGKSITNGTVKPVVPSEIFVTGLSVVKPDVQDTTLPLPNIEPAKPNVEPKGEAAYKVGGENKMLILGYCSTTKTLVAINSHLKRAKGKLDDTAALLKRLWTLELLFFDGEFYITKK